MPRPGEVSLAPNAVLFLDELPEFPRNVLEVLRQPLMDRNVTIARASMSLSFAAFMLAAAMNPCLCGYFNDKSRECHCTPPLIQRYLCVEGIRAAARPDRYPHRGTAVQYRELRGGAAAESSAVIRARILKARDLQRERFERADGHAADSPFGELGSDAEKLLGRTRDAAAGTHHPRHDRAIADLEGESNLTVARTAEAIYSRTLHRSYWN